MTTKISYSIRLGMQNPITNEMYSEMYSEFNDKIEQMTKILYFVMLKLSLAGFSIPILAVTIGNYFLYDLGDESYILPCPVM